MVTVRRQQQAHEADLDGNFEQWLDRVSEACHVPDRELFARACERARQSEDAGERAGRVWPYVIGCYRIGLQMVDILAELHADGAMLPAAVLYRSVREGHISLLEVEREFGIETASLIEGVLRMAAIGAVLNPTRKAVLGQHDGQLDNVRKMLVAMVDDVRVALLKLAERTVIIRAVKNAEEERRQKVAREVFDIYAPLAHRLGVGQLKWELEDLSFRYLQPGAYKKIAKLLDEKRLDRESFIDNVLSQLKTQLEKFGIEHAEVQGRAKHIYSIWRKMQKKHLDFYEVYDVRAVRILVKDLRDIGSTRSVTSQITQIGNTAGTVQLAQLLKRLRHSDHVTWLILLSQTDHDAKNLLVLLAVEILLTDPLGNLIPGLFAEHQTTQHRLFRLHRLGRQTQIFRQMLINIQWLVHSLGKPHGSKKKTGTVIADSARIVSPEPGKGQRLIPPERLPA